jgi:hypothetical protein
MCMCMCVSARARQNDAPHRCCIGLLNAGHRERIRVLGFHIIIFVLLLLLEGVACC